ncbi:PREDICTED: histone-lysine N-methyltransferase EZH2-like, partial [Rhagoletis zephyria]|uniref:histone-lysine N-methyltransferase EZH2-like n=1 Tax=Rhagoletis zephyria TaxID=28612 RepID=UPI000811977D
CTWAPLLRNVLAPDETTLHHVPYIADSVVNDIEWQDDLLELYDDRVHMPAEHFMTDDILSDTVDVITGQAWGEGDIVMWPRTLKAPAEPIAVDQELAFELVSLYIVNYAFSPEELKEKYRNYQRVKNKEALNVSTLMPNIDGNEEEDHNAVHSREEALNSFQELFCPQCFIYDCNSHVFCEPISKPQSEGWLAQGTSKPCGEDCYLNFVSRFFAVCLHYL